MIKRKLKGKNKIKTLLITNFYFSTLQRVKTYHKDGIPYRNSLEKSKLIPWQIGEPDLYFSTSSRTGIAISFVVCKISRAIGRTTNFIYSLLGWFLNIWIVVIIALYIGEVKTTLKFMLFTYSWWASAYKIPIGCNSGSSPNGSSSIAFVSGDPGPYCSLAYNILKLKWERPCLIKT